MNICKLKTKLESKNKTKEKKETKAGVANFWTGADWNVLLF